MLESALSPDAKEILKDLRAKYPPEFVELYDYLLCDLAQDEADITRTTIDLNDEGDVRRSETSGNEYQAPKASLRSQYKKSRTTTAKLLILAYESFCKINSTDARSGRKPKTPEEEAMGL